MNVFDILGPVMIGPSSSHTAGAARIGLVTRALLGKTPVKAHIFLHGSFAKTYKGHGTDKALVAGILGMQTDYERIRFSLDVAKKEGLEIQIETGELENTHPNTAEITLTAADGEKVSLRGSSIGGGNGGCPYRAESCFDRASQGCTRDDCCGYRADGRVWGEYLQFSLGARDQGWSGGNDYRERQPLCSGTQ